MSPLLAFDRGSSASRALDRRFEALTKAVEQAGLYESRTRHGILRMKQETLIQKVVQSVDPDVSGDHDARDRLDRRKRFHRRKLPKTPVMIRLIAHDCP